MNNTLTVFPADFIHFIQTNSLVEIKGGMVRERFHEIWMVEVQGRVFARSWEKSSKSWFTAFLEEGCGQLKYHGNVINVQGQQMKDVETNRQVDMAYRSKYTQERNLYYVDGITKPSYYDFCMEFFFVS